MLVGIIVAFYSLKSAQKELKPDSLTILVMLNCFVVMITEGAANGF